MKKYISIVTATIIITLFVVVSNAQSSNLVVNGGFEDGFRSLPVTNPPDPAVGNSWFYGYNASFGSRPEWKPETALRVRTGQVAQKWFTTFAPHDGWIWQQVCSVEPDTILRLTAWVYVWSSSESNVDTSIKPGKVWTKVGINPWGDTNALNFSTQWGTTYVDRYNQWVQLEAIVRAKNECVTVFLRDRADYGAKHNDVYWDDVHLDVLAADIPQPCPTPIPCPSDGSDCPSLDTILKGVEDIVRSREPVRWPQ